MVVCVHRLPVVRYIPHMKVCTNFVHLLGMPLAVAVALAAPTFAQAAPSDAFVVDVPLAADGRPQVDPDAYDAWLEEAAGLSEGDAVHVELRGRLPDGVEVPLEDLLPRVAAVPGPVGSEGSLGLEGPGVDHPGEGTGALSGKTVYVSQCHGWIWFDSLGRFSTQRGVLYDTVEDFHNPEGADAFLVRYLENAGARVVTIRERDHSTEMAVVKPSSASDGAYQETGAGFVDGSAGFGDGSAWHYGDNPFTAGDTRRFPDSSGNVATWSVDVPADGDYGLYIAYSASSDQSTTATYRITHPGGVIERTIDQTTHGSTWNYLEMMWLPAGTGTLTVELVGNGTGDWLSAGAVRIGGGMGDVRRNDTSTGRPRWEEGAILHTQWNGAPTSVYDPYGEGDGSDPSSRSRYAAWRSPPGEDAIYLSWHSNAGGGTGTSTYTYEGSSGAAVAGSHTFGQLVQDELVSSIRVLWDSSWSDRGHRTAAFSEVSPYHNPEMPAALVELAFHDHAEDTALLKEPEFRRDAARAMTRGIVRYFADRDGVSASFLPEPPGALTVLHEGGELMARWQPGVSGDPFGDAATGYRVYLSADGRSWDNGADVSDTAWSVPSEEGETVFVRVSAVNAGGESFPTAVLGARRMPAGVPPVLIVDGFDRLDRALLPWEDVPVLGNLRRMTHLSRLNPYDGAARHGRVLADTDWFFDTADDNQLNEVDLGAYRTIVWVGGEESTLDESLDDAQQALLWSYWEGGGTLVVSGSEILWDLDYLGSDGDRDFASSVLGAGMASDDAGVTSAIGLDLLDGLVLDFDEAAGSPYPVEYPDVLSTDRTVIAEYAAGQPAAAMGEGVAHFGFPIETIGDEEVRGQVLDAVLWALVPDWEAPDTDPGDDGGDGGDGGDDDGGGDGGLPDTGTDELDSSGNGPGERLDFDKEGCACSQAVDGRSTHVALLGLLPLIVFRRRESGLGQR